MSDKSNQSPWKGTRHEIITTLGALWWKQEKARQDRLVELQSPKNKEGEKPPVAAATKRI